STTLPPPHSFPTRRSSDLPESTVPLSFTTTAFYRNAIESASRARNADIILGSVAEDPSQPRRMWNAAFLVSGGHTIGHYDKIRRSEEHTSELQSQSNLVCR